MTQEKCGANRAAEFQRTCVSGKGERDYPAAPLALAMVVAVAVVVSVLTS